MKLNKTYLTLIMIISNILLIVSCQTSPQEIKTKLTVPSIPDPFLFEIIETSGEGVLISHDDAILSIEQLVDTYNFYMQLLILMEVSEYYIQEDLEREIEFCQSVLDWLETLKG